MKHKESQILTVPDQPVRIDSGSDSATEQVHVFDEESIWALNAAVAARRPLLVRGEPGVGKTQLARAAGVITKRLFVSYVVDSQTQSRDLLWEFDAVQRLAEAQILGALGEPLDSVREALAVEKFIKPGPVWWAFDWQGAKQQAERLHLREPPGLAERNPRNGAVLLIDEIDKAESDVPNGLLEALGAGQFVPEGGLQPVTIQGQHPLVIITTNEERVLPDAFVRRCLVLHLRLPEEDQKLRELLFERALAHFPGTAEEVLGAAADLLLRDRREAINNQIFPLPGQAEYLDLVRAVTEIGKDVGEQRDVLARVSRFVLDKSAGTKS